MATFLPGINQTQTNLALVLGQTKLDEANKTRAIKLMFIQNFMERIHTENARKKADARAKTAAQQQAAISAGAILAGGVIGGLGGAGAAGLSATSAQSGINFSQNIPGNVNDFGGFNQIFGSGSQPLSVQQIMAR